MTAYPRCATCPHPWHGLRCEWSTCECPGNATSGPRSDEQGPAGVHGAPMTQDAAERR